MTIFKRLKKLFGLSIPLFVVHGIEEYLTEIYLLDRDMAFIYDLHSNRNNLMKDDVPEGVRIIRELDYNLLPELIDTIFLMNFHAGNGTAAGYAHSFSYDLESGETTTWASITASSDVSISFLSGDSLAVEELKILYSDCNCVITKTLQETFETSDIIPLIEEAAEKAIRESSNSLPVTESFMLKLEWAKKRDLTVLSPQNYTSRTGNAILIQAQKAYRAMNQFEALL